MSDSDLIHSVEGEIISTTALLRAMIETHPNRAQLRALFEQKYQAALATNEAQPVKEAFLDGMREQADRLWFGF